MTVVACDVNCQRGGRDLLGSIVGVLFAKNLPVNTASSGELDLPHTLVAGSERALGLLRRALSAVPGFFVSHLPIEGPRCVEALEGSERRVMWMSPWAVSHAQYVAAHLQRACFVVINAGNEAALIPSECRSLQLTETALANTPDDEVKRLVRFLQDEK